MNICESKGCICVTCAKKGRECMECLNCASNEITKHCESKESKIKPEMKYILEIEFETEKHCILCPVRDDETDDCKMQYCKEFTTWEEQMKNCPLKEVKHDA